MSNEKDFLGRYSEEEYKKVKEKALERYYKNREQCLAKHREWNEINPLKVLEGNRQRGRKGGRHYEKHLQDAQTGIRGERNKIRCKDRRKWRLYKLIIAPDSQLHHQWLIETSEYTGIALVEADQHMHGFINVIQILKGKITLFTEKEIRGSQN